MRSINHRSALTLVAGPGRIPEGEGDFDCMVTVALDGILELTGAERGILRLHDACGELILETARARGRKNLAPSEHRALRPLIEVLRARGLPYQQGHVLAHPVSLGRPAPAAPWRLGPAARRESSHGLIYLSARREKASRRRHRRWSSGSRSWWPWKPPASCASVPGAGAASTSAGSSATGDAALLRITADLASDLSEILDTLFHFLLEEDSVDKRLRSSPIPFRLGLWTNKEGYHHGVCLYDLRSNLRL